VPNMRVGHCLGPEGNGVSSGEGGEGGPCPPSRKEDSSLLPTRKEATWNGEKKEGQVGCYEEEPACTQ
jgi:hypothetical protein